MSVDAPQTPRAGHAISVPTLDGQTLQGRAFDPARSAAMGAALVVVPALGARARIYGRLARHLVKCGHGVLPLDPRTVGSTGPAASRAVDIDVDPWLHDDYRSGLAAAAARWPDRPRILLGHSIRGQRTAALAGVYPDALDGAILLTAAHVGLGNFPWLRRPAVLMLLALFNLLGLFFGYIPGHRIGWGAPLARTMTKRWSLWTLRGRYHDGRGTDLEAAFTSVQIPVLAISFTDDRTIAPATNTAALVSRLTSAPVTHWHLKPKDIDLDAAGHFDHLQGAPTLWDRMDGWIRDSTDTTDAQAS